MLIELYDDQLDCANWIVYELGLNPTNPCLQWFANKFLAGFAADPDIAVYSMMGWKLMPVEDYQIDLSYLRLRPTLYGGNGVTTW